MSYKLWYDSIGKRIHQSTEISCLSGRDKVELFQHLMDELGITEAFQEFPDQTAWAQELLIKQWDKHWGAK